MRECWIAKLKNGYLVRVSKEDAIEPDEAIQSILKASGVEPWSEDFEKLKKTFAMLFKNPLLAQKNYDDYVFLSLEDALTFIRGKLLEGEPPIIETV